ncbi:MAG: prolyl oligopeptidase family serine peptidase [Aggregatilineales bacterium]
MTQTEHTFRAMQTIDGEMPYLLHLPDGYEETEESFPLILFLHGMGERGNDLDLLRTQGLAKKLDHQHDFPFIVVSPQCSLDSWWSLQIDVLIRLLDEIIATHRVDTTRVYLTGLSMGGYGTWALASSYPERFAAIAPICGGMDHWFDLETRAQALSKMPIWTFHGAADDVVPITLTERVIAAIEAAGGTVKYTIYPRVNHDSWTQTYANPELYTWFLSHTLSGNDQ